MQSSVWKRIVLVVFVVLLSVAAVVVALSQTSAVSLAQSPKLTTLASPVPTPAASRQGQTPRTYLPLVLNNFPPAAPRQSGLTPRAYLPLVLNNFPPISSTSYYVKNADPTALFQLGCAQAYAITHGQSIVAVLDFGQAWYDGTSYGAKIFDDNLTFESIYSLTASADNYLAGFYQCSPVDEHLILVVGINNQGAWVNNAHGSAWAQMINNINEWITGLHYDSQLSARGGMDIEQAPPYGTAAATRSWVDGYSATYSGESAYYDFGSCDWCPTTSNPGAVLPQDWTIEDVWYVAYGAAPAFPLPDIYETSGFHAAQWHQMSQYAATQHGKKMNFIGSMTQYRACLQRGCDPSLMNLPSDGYLWLYNALNADPLTAQSLAYSTDINWQGENP